MLLLRNVHRCLLTSLSSIAAPESLTSKVVKALRAAILGGEIAPGERLSVPDLARRLGVSRTPAREALLVLEREGLVESRPRLGTVVLSGGKQGLKQLFELREALDGMAARLAAGAFSDAQSVALSQIVDDHRLAIARKDMERHIALDVQFHASIREGCGNAYLRESLLQIERRIMLFMRAFSALPRAMGPEVIRDHGEIAEAIGAGDGSKAEAAARRHVRNVRKFYQASQDRLSDA
jgi:DNA-binding GntR family transcriptional regulator